MTTARDVVDERTGEHQADDVTIRDMMLVVNERLFRPQSEGELVSFLEVDVADDPAAAAARAAGTVAVRSVVREASPGRLNSGVREFSRTLHHSGRGFLA